jgi:hypothetical protein
MKPRSAFTLFELILAIALSATLLALIGTAINLYLVRMDTSRMRVEEAQLARSILATIAADLRAASVYQTQDISSVSQLAMQAVPFDPSDIDQAGEFTQSALQSTGTTGTTGGVGGSTAVGSGSETGSSGSGGSSGQSSDGSQDTSTTTVPGLNGLVNEILLDVMRLPRLDELFPASPDQASSAAAAANVPRPSDAKVIRYFVRQGSTIDPSDIAATAISSEANLTVGGLVRQTLDRAVRETAVQGGNSQVLNSGQVLLAPEVTQLQFIYFDGATAIDTWDMQERGTMPTAVEVRIWIAPDAIEAEESAVPLQPRLYRQTVDLPMALASGATTTSTMSEEESTEEEETEEEDPTGQIPGLNP